MLDTGTAVDVTLRPVSLFSVTAVDITALLQTLPIAAAADALPFTTFRHISR